VITRGGSPNGSRRVARRAAALLDQNLTVGIDQVFGPRVKDLVESFSSGLIRLSSDFFPEWIPLPLAQAKDHYGLYAYRTWRWSWVFTRLTTDCRAEDGASP
jgi:hypothetical protein